MRNEFILTKICPHFHPLLGYGTYPLLPWPPLAVMHSAVWVTARFPGWQTLSPGELLVETDLKSYLFMLYSFISNSTAVEHRFGPGIVQGHE